LVLADLKRLLKFNEWANARVFDAVAALTPEQVCKDLGSSFPCVGLTAAHLVAGEWIWLQRWLGISNSKFPEWANSTDIADLRRRLTDIETERWALFHTLTEADLLTPRHYKLMSGLEDQQPLDVMITHVVNHATYHRGQIATMFRQLGLKPTGTDFITFAREQ
jgi:uncharacterized damage-inducible protein DinB